MSVWLNSNPPCLVDDDLAEQLSFHKWQGGKGRNRCYFMAWFPGVGHVYLHRLIYELRNGKINRRYHIDHRDRNPFNNTSKNLRAATRQLNQANRGRNKGNLSGFRGVSLTKERNKWRARHIFGGREVVIGIFKCPVEAARAVNAAFLKMFPDVTPPNNV